MTGRCNICGWSDRFLRLERGREGTVCRNCGSSSRNRAVAWVLGRVLGEDQAVFRWKYRTSMPMLESSARGALAMYFRKKFDYYGTEYDPKKIAAGNQPRDYADFQKLHYADHTFDFVVASDVLKRIRRDTDAMREVQRVLKPGGHLILTVPYDHDRAQTLERVDTSGPYREYGRDLIDLMRAASFNVERVEVERPDFGITPQSVFVARKGQPVALAPERTLREGSTGPIIAFRLFVACKNLSNPFGEVRDLCPFNLTSGVPQLLRDARHALRP